MDGLILGDEAPSFLRTPHHLKAQPKNIRMGLSKLPFFSSAKGLGEYPLAHFHSSERAHLRSVNSTLSNNVKNLYHTSRFRAIEGKPWVSILILGIRGM
jgi:hypothetical protein